MEEKVLIRSYSSKKTKQFFIGVVIGLLAIAIIFLFLGIRIGKEEWAYYRVSSYYGGYKCLFCGELDIKYIDAFEHLLTVHSAEADIVSFGLWAFILHWSFIFLAGIFYLIYFLISRCNITVTDKNIAGRTFWGKKVILPIHMVSAYSTSKIFSVVAITTASAFIKFPCIGNYEEIADVLQQLLNERQKRTETQEGLILPQRDSKNLDDLVRLKSLLDDGIITQEEFNEKKKQLLGLL